MSALKERRYRKASLWFRRICHRWYVDPAMSLEQTLMSNRQERKTRVVILVVDFHALGKTRRGIACSDQADQHTIHVHLIAIRCSSATDFPAVGKTGIDRRINREH